MTSVIVVNKGWPGRFGCGSPRSIRCPQTERPGHPQVLPVADDDRNLRQSGSLPFFCGNFSVDGSVMTFRGNKVN